MIMLFMLLPSVVNFIHSAENHNHNIDCENKSEIHIHQKELDCCLCDITLQNDGVFSITNEVYFISCPEFAVKTDLIQTVYSTLTFTSGSRGPPFC